MKLRRVTAWACLGGYLTAVGPAFAQGAAPKAAPKPAPSTPPAASVAPAPAAAAPSGAGIADIVRLKDGSMVRGAIVEMTRGESVSILLPNGETRVFNLALVEYAGPVAGAPTLGGGTTPEGAPPPPPPAAPAPAPDAPARVQGPPVHFESSEPLTFSIQTSTSEAAFEGWNSNVRLRVNRFDHVCTSPCETQLPKGSYRFSLTKDGKTVATEREVPVVPGNTVQGEYKSHSGMRAAGYVVLIGGGAAGLIYMLSGKTTTGTCSGSDYNSCDYSTDTSDVMNHIYVGLAIVGVSTLVGTLLILKHDEATVRVLPGVTPANGNGTVADRQSAFGGFDPRGLTLQAKF